MVTVDGVPLDEASGVTGDELRGIPMFDIRKVRLAGKQPRRRASRVRVSWDLGVLRQRIDRLAGECE